MRRLTVEQTPQVCEQELQDLQFPQVDGTKSKTKSVKSKIEIK